MIFSSDV